MAFPISYAREFQIFSNAVKNNNTAGIRSARDSLPKILDVLMRRLYQLRSSEAHLLSRLRRDVSITDALAHSVDEHTSNLPTQSYENPNRNVSDPDPTYAVVMDKLAGAAEGMNYLQQELNKISSEIRETDAEIRRTNGLLTKINNSKIEASDQDKDKIATAMVSSLIGLREIALQYVRYSTSPDGTRGFSQDPVLCRILSRLQKNFNALADRNPWVLSGDIVLNYGDPGSDSNLTALVTTIDKIRGTVAIPDTVDDSVLKYINEMVTQINNPNISKQVVRDPVPFPKTGVGRTVNNISGFLNMVGGAMQGALDRRAAANNKSSQDAQRLNFFSWVSKVNNGLPICGMEPNEEERKIKEMNAKAKAAEDKATKDAAQQIEGPSKFVQQ